MGPFPSELFDPDGERLARRGDEFGATTGRPRRCGWLDAVALRRMVKLNGVSGLCVTKLDVLDGFDEIKVCTAYRLYGDTLDAPPLDATHWVRSGTRVREFPRAGRIPQGARPAWRIYRPMPAAISKPWKPLSGVPGAHRLNRARSALKTSSSNTPSSSSGAGVSKAGVRLAASKKDFSECKCLKEKVALTPALEKQDCPWL